METIDQSQNIVTEKDNAQFSKDYRTLLSPCIIPNEDSSHLAVDDLVFALKQSDSRNIAVTGHYGSGKSSVVNTAIREMGIDDNVLRISMSTFSLKTEPQSANDALYSDEVEYKIVQHLLYKCDKNRIPFRVLSWSLAAKMGVSVHMSFLL